MSLPYFAQLVQRDEHIQGVFYRSGRMAIWQLFIIALLLWAPLYAYFPLQQRLGSQAVWIVLLSVVVAIFIFIRTGMQLRYTAWIITNERLIDISQKGIVQYDISEEYIEDLYRPMMLYTSVWERLVGCATVRVYIAHERSFLELPGVRNAQEIVAFLETVLPDTEVIKKKIKKLRREVGEEEFEDMLEEMSEEA